MKKNEGNMNKIEQTESPRASREVGPSIEGESLDFF